MEKDKRNGDQRTSLSLKAAARKSLTSNTFIATCASQKIPFQEGTSFPYFLTLLNPINYKFTFLITSPGIKIAQFKNKKTFPETL
jgi:hypothetical protein